jgi:hypothetical protein
MDPKMSINRKKMLRSLTLHGNCDEFGGLPTELSLANLGDPLGPRPELPPST